MVGGAAARGTYTAYEPHPRSAHALRTNLALNGVTGVRAVEAAVVGEVGATDYVELLGPLGIDRATPTSAMVGNSPSRDLLQELGPTESFTVEAVAMSDAFGSCDLLKIDVEGLESELLRAAHSPLVAQQPCVMLEVHDFAEELHALLPGLAADLEASVFAMRRDHLVLVDNADLAGSMSLKYRTWDFLIVPRRRHDLVSGLIRP